MIYMGKINSLALIFSLWIYSGCSPGTKDHALNSSIEKLRKEFRLGAFDKLLVLDLEKCQSCNMGIAKPVLDFHTQNPDAIVVIYSGSEKKARIFYDNDPANFIWDGTGLSKKLNLNPDMINLYERHHDKNFNWVDFKILYPN